MAGTGCPELPITPLVRLRRQLLSWEGSAPGSWAAVDRPARCASFHMLQN